MNHISKADFDNCADLWNLMLAHGLQNLDAFEFCTARMNQYLLEQEYCLPVLDPQAIHVAAGRA